MSDNLKIWNAVCTTDPAFTKKFNRGGGFSGTATNVTYLIRKATELWGPLGGEWGFRVVDEKYVQGVPFRGDDGEVVAHETVHVLRIEFRHPTGTIESFGQTTFVGKNKNGLYTDEEAPKKSLTDALSKALSWLGFAADVHLGLYDDNKYVNDLKRKFETGETDSPGDDALTEKKIEELLSAIAQAPTIDELQKLRDKSFAAGKKADNLEALKRLKAAITARLAALKKPAREPGADEQEQEHATT